MTPKNAPPIDVTLKKSTSGTWALPEAPKIAFKPWQRLWFVTGIIYLLILAGSYHFLMPDQESIERRMVLSVTDEVRRYDGMAFAGESPRRIFDIARSQGFAIWIAQIRSKYRIGADGDPGFEKIEKRYRDAISDLPVKRTVGILLCFLFWLLPMSLLYSIGFVVDWIKRGGRVIRVG